MEELSNDINRRKFISSLGLLGVAGLSSLPSLAEAGETKTSAPDVPIIKTEPYLQSALPNQITVRWLTNVPCYSWVDYGQTPDNLDKKEVAVDDGLIQAYNTVHGITLKGLTPGQKYYYRINSKVIEEFKPYKVTFGNTFVSESYTFQTPGLDAKSVSFLVFNDIHDRPNSFAHLMQYGGEDKKDFVFLNGDMFDFQTDEDQLVNHLLNPLGQLFSTNTPFILSRGNHETRGKFARHLGNYFNNQEQKYYFSFQQGPVYAIVLDSGEDKTDGDKEYYGLVDFDKYRLQQVEWLKKEVQKKAFKKAKYKIVFSHIPFYYSGNGHGTLHCREVFGPILNQAKVDLLISGHTHRYGIHPPVAGQHNYPIVIGGGPKEGARTIIKVKADQNAFALEMIGDTGTPVGNIKI
ncbi:purple acid phosphatase family protein [Adhaeribacter rhizoryzae]|uniref:Metallophosphoesterase family protein n=1 Tax=Adhaeribacter rhizoryzae TaxID=2607907 RepID=A0A5M6D5U6_9BACT|nr:metallophosphoesterase family protein [Adhaeribacter rhizoryzae]KAA5540575.1 metallophosphoesterase family protein [Adhaeribacter rhizoryzae]